MASSRLIIFIATTVAIAIAGLGIAYLSISTDLLPIGGKKTQEQQSSTSKTTIQDFERWQTIGNCYGSPSEQCDKQMIAIAQFCQVESQQEEISCKDAKLTAYLSKRGLAIPR
jgi:flagellar basal body-associated protein FliL